MSEDVTPKSNATLLLISGFLGAGKTTWIGAAVKEASDRGLRCAVVTNDQAAGLVDTATARKFDATQVVEVSGACFCCKLDELVARIDKLCAADRPDLIFAEPVGSCTDLTATIILPLQLIYQRPLTVAPLTVLLDARRALTTYGGRSRQKDFAKEVGYIFHKQLEEAAILVVNKADVLREDERKLLNTALELKFPFVKLIWGSALKGEGVAVWLDEAFSAQGAPESLMEVDYELYGRGEAMLGWVNMSVAVVFTKAIDGGAWLLQLAKAISSKLENVGCEVAHFKMSLESEERYRSRVHQVLSGEVPVLAEQASVLIRGGLLLINLRAEGDPTVFSHLVHHAFGQVQGEFKIEQSDAFRPGQPVPTHRVSGLTKISRP
jgi:Ni2+-binding GTPase involved in maturation of urease and hydrogenase